MDVKKYSLEAKKNEMLGNPMDPGSLDSRYTSGSPQGSYIGEINNSSSAYLNNSSNPDNAYLQQNQSDSSNSYMNMNKDGDRANNNYLQKPDEERKDKGELEKEMLEKNNSTADSSINSNKEDKNNNIISFTYNLEENKVAFGEERLEEMINNATAEVSIKAKNTKEGTAEDVLDTVKGFIKENKKKTKITS